MQYETQENGVPYEHPDFVVGSFVYVDPSILDIHPKSPLAGQLLEVCRGTSYPLLEAIEGKKDSVPVLWQGEVWYVEQEYAQRKRSIL